MSFSAFSKFAPMRSILLTKAMRGTLYLVAWRQTVSDCGCTPATPQNTATAPSSTRRDRSPSAVKSTWPGVSMMSEVHVARGIDDVDAVRERRERLVEALFLLLGPETGHRRRRDRDAALAL